jgi:hypothetical protein
MKGLIEQRQCLLCLVRHVRRDESERPEIEAIGVEASRMRLRRALDLGPLQPRLEEAGDLVGDPILKIKNVFQRRVELVRPQSGERVCVKKLRANSHAPPGFAQPTPKDVAKT